jgi:hypothetical protein
LGGIYDLNLTGCTGIKPMSALNGVHTLRFENNFD